MKYYGRERVCASFISKKGKILNIGAGQIRWIENDLLLGNKNLYSSDIEKRNLGKDNLAKNKLIINAEDIPFKKGFFSQLIILDVLEHIKNDKLAIKEINRVLKKGGKLIISVPNDNFLSYFNPVRYVQHERHYTIDQITRMLVNNGFKIENLFAGGSIFELFAFYMHLFIKYTTGRLVNLSIFNKLRDKEYAKHNKNGNEIIIKAKKIK